MTDRTFDDLDEASQAVVEAWEQDRREKRALMREHFQAAHQQRIDQAAAALEAAKQARKAERVAAEAVKHPPLIPQPAVPGTKE